MEHPIPIDEQILGDRVRNEKEQDGKAHDDGECDPNWKNCGYAKPMYDQNGHFDEIYCCYKNNELNWCGVPCPLTKGE